MTTKLIEVYPYINLKQDSLPLIIGNFECIHQGHIKLIKQLAFEQFDFFVLKNIPRKLNNHIYNFEQKIEQIKLLKPRNIYFLDLAVNNMSANDFNQNILKMINPQKIIVGNDFYYGKDFCYATKLKEVSDTTIVEIDPKFKTSNIKEILRNGHVTQANKMLASNFAIYGIVIKGKQIGRKIGFPTANIIRDINMSELKAGSYAGYTYVNERKYASLVFVWEKNQTQLIETHLMDDFHQDIYDQQIKIELIDFVRANEKPKDLDHLIELIKAGQKKVVAILNRYNQ